MSVVNFVGLLDDDYDDDIDWYAEHYSRCDCPYCFCTEMTEGGVRCVNCRSGAHQG